MKNKKMILALIALIAVVGLMAGIWYGSRPQPKPQNDAPKQTQGADDVDNMPQQSEGTGDADTTPTGYSKYFTVEVVHADGTVKTFEYGTNEDYLGAVLVAEGLIVEGSSPGMYITVDGETADWNVNQSYWGFFINGEYAMEGMDTTLIEDGTVYRLEYTRG